MKRTIRKIALLCIVLSLIVGICVPAFAAYPQVKLYRAPSTAYRGYYMDQTYYLNSGSYSYRGGYRARYTGEIRQASTNRRYAWWDRVFTGRVYDTIRTAVYTYWPRGRYKTQLKTFYRRSASGRWKYVRGFYFYFNVR